MLSATGPLLCIDVGNRTVATESIDTVLDRFIGGRGVATWLAHDRIPFDVDPLGPENRLYFTTGPLQQSTMSFTGRTNATAVSPLTDGLASSNAGGFISRNFVGTGYAAIELVGQSEELVIIHVTDDDVTFESVPHLADTLVSDVTKYIEEEHGLGAEHIAAIGPAGERLVRFASIMTTDSRAFGRGGLGAVMGSKQVKAITMDGDVEPSVSIDPIQMEVHRDAATSNSLMKRQGTTNVVDIANEVDGFPTRYFSERHFEHADRINGDVVEQKKYKKGTCSACAFACKLPTRDDDTGVETEGPEFETVMAFGSNCAIDDIVSIMRSNQLCDELGMDTISCGNTIAAYLASEDAFGDSELIHETVEKIAYRDGIGDHLAEGIDRCADELGVPNWTVKGLDFAAHEGRALHGQGLAYAVANRGADHMYSTFYAWEYPFVSKTEAFPKEGFSGKPPKIAEQENVRALEDCGILCRFSRGDMNPERFSALFDADYTDLLAVGGAVVALERHFNNQRGFDRNDDVLPYDLPGINAALDEYYAVRGWNSDGTVPTENIEYTMQSAD